MALVFLLCFLRNEVFSKVLALENFHFDLLVSNACFLPNLYGVRIEGITCLCYFIAMVATFSYRVTCLTPGCWGKWSPVARTLHGSDHSYSVGLERTLRITLFQSPCRG